MMIFLAKRILILFFVVYSIALFAQPPADSVKKDNVKKGWNFEALPVLGYDSDLGFQYGALANIYYYGDGSTYPQYFHSFYAEVSRTTKGGGINQVFFDSPKLIKGIRVTTDVTYLTERALNFYGFNGYDAVYNPDWENDQLDSATYKSRVYYRYQRQLLRAGLDFRGNFFHPHLYWLAGFTFLKIDIAPVNIDRLNKGKSEDKKLPDVPGLYDDYVKWGVITPEEKNGGINNFVKLGMIYDTRDNEGNPMHGIWSEVIVALAPGFIGDGHYSFAKVSVIHRQYFTLVKDVLSFAYRLGYQGTFAGSAPFYIQPYMINSFSQTTTIDGLGGSRTLRGILRDRVTGDGVGYGNFEFRWKFYRFHLIKQNFYLALNAFADAGMVLDKVQMQTDSIPSTIDKSRYFSNGSENLHLAVGGGLRIAMNQNFVICADFGFAPDKRDGRSGIYVGLGYLF